MASVDVDVRDTLVLVSLRNAAKRQRYAIAGAINTTLRAIQASVPDHMRRQGFVVRNPRFLFGSGKYAGGAANRISHFAKPIPGRQFGRIEVKPGNASGNRRFLLAQYERGGERRPMMPGAKSVGVPLLGHPARPTMASPVPAELQLRALKLKKTRGKRTVIPRYWTIVFGRKIVEKQRVIRGADQIKGAMRTFVLKETSGVSRGAVFQRFGPNKRDIRLLYPFVKPPHLRNTLHFADNAARVTAQTFRPALLAEVNKTLKFHAFTPRKLAA